MISHRAQLVISGLILAERGLKNCIAVLLWAGWIYLMAVLWSVSP